MNISLSPFAPENLVSRDGFGSPVPRQPARLHTQAESDAYLRDSSRVPRQCPSIYLNRHTPSGQSQVYRVTQLRTGGVHCWESAGTGPVNLKIVPNECCLGRSQYAPLVGSWLSRLDMNTRQTSIKPMYYDCVAVAHILSLQDRHESTPVVSIEQRS